MTVMPTYDKQITALLVIDPYNDFISEGGKVWDRLKGVAEANGCVPHMLQVSSVRLTFEQIQLVGRIRGNRVRRCECKQLMQWCCLEQGQTQDL
jgi:hypothetical protein